MNTIVNRKIALITAGILCAVWCAAVLFFGNIGLLGFSGWFSFLYVPVCIAAVLFCTYYYKPLKNDSGAVSLPIHYSLVLLIFAVVVNAGYIFAGQKAVWPFIAIADIVLLAVYLIIALYACVYLDNLSGKSRKAEQNTRFSVTVSRELGAMLAQVEDPGVHQALAGLKELVDYSTNSTRQAEEEVPILSKLDELKSAMGNGQASEDAMRLIGELTSLWKTRNSKL